jgi:RHS repeat-associated protein
MQSPGSQGTRDAPTPEVEEVFSLAADPQLAENSRQGSERKNRAFALGFEELKSQTMQWGSWQASGRTASVPTVYLYDGANLIEEVDNAGNVLARYTQSGLIDESLGMLRSGVTSYYQADGLGSTSSLSNSAGTLANTYTYDSFGKLTASTGTLLNPFQYTGREFDLETGIYEYRARYYDQNAGRFISEDPIAFRGGVNFYRYVLNNPVINVDPPGLGPNGWGNKGWTWTTRANCFFSFVTCLAHVSDTRQSLDQMTPDAVVNTSTAMDNQAFETSQRLQCGLSGDHNCYDTLKRCTKLALTNPFPPPWYLKGLIGMGGK